MDIVANNGKVYHSLRAYHIAMGHAVRQALLNLAKETKQYAIQEVENYYDMEFHGSEYYDNTYGMIESIKNSEDIDSSFSSFVKGNWAGNVGFDIEIDWSNLNGHSNGYGQWGTYTSLDGSDVTVAWESFLKAGLPKGILKVTGERHIPFDLQKKVDEYVDKRIDKIINKVIQDF